MYSNYTSQNVKYTTKKAFLPCLTWRLLQGFGNFEKAQMIKTSEANIAGGFSVIVNVGVGNHRRIVFVVAPCRLSLSFEEEEEKGGNTMARFSPLGCPTEQR